MLPSWSPISQNAQQFKRHNPTEIEYGDVSNLYYNGKTWYRNDIIHSMMPGNLEQHSSNKWECKIPFK